MTQQRRLARRRFLGATAATAAGMMVPTAIGLGAEPADRLDGA